MIKNHAIINRLSEDLDFKISTKNYMRPAVPKSKLKALDAEIQKNLEAAQFDLNLLYRSSIQFPKSYKPNRFCFEN